MASAGELQVNRVNTEAFIAANPSYVALIPRTATKTGEGILYVDGPPRASQRFRLIDQSSTNGPQPGSIVGADGTQRRVDYQLLGKFDAIVGLNDYWVDAAGIRWEVAELLPDNGYERRARVVRYGE
jgi:hypothetical protein